MDDPFNFLRFVSAQDNVWRAVQTELVTGRKTSHWMWYVFPQIRGLGSSGTAQLYSIQSLDEAAAYLDHAVLGPRLTSCTALVNEFTGKTAREIFGSPDDMKFRSCMTLFAHVVPPNPLFTEAISKFFGGKPDPLTLSILAKI